MNGGIHPPRLLPYPFLIRTSYPFTAGLTERVFQSNDLAATFCSITTWLGRLSEQCRNIILSNLIHCHDVAPTVKSMLFHLGAALGKLLSFVLYLLASQSSNLHFEACFSLLKYELLTISRLDISPSAVHPLSVYTFFKRMFSCNL